MIDAVEGRQQLERPADGALDLHGLAETAARASGTAGVGTILLAPEQQRRDGFRHLYRRPAHA
jgi:hypothetical protein